MNPQHQSLSDQHFTPPYILDYVRLVMGGIDLDPCTSESVNNWSVKANLFFDADGINAMDALLGWRSLDRKGPVKVWCNPPGGKTKNQSNMKIWLEAIAQHHQNGKIEQCFFLLFNREFLGHPCLQSIPRLNFTQRVKYWGWDDVNQCFREGNWKTVTKGEGDYVLDKTKNYWKAIDKHGNVLQFEATKEDLIRWAKSRKYAIREWTNSPTQQSTLLYFPPSNQDWQQKLDNASTKIVLDGYWVIPV